MTNNIVKLYPKDSSVNPDNVLEQAIGNYETVFMIGYDKEGRFDARASTNMTQETILWLIETFKTAMMDGDYGDE